MDISGLRNKFEAWVPYLRGIELLIEYLPRDELKALSKQAVTTEVDPKTRERVEKFDNSLAEQLICQRVVKGWREVNVDEGGNETYGEAFVDGDQPFPCTTENVALLAEKLSGFAIYVNKICVDLQALVDIEKEQTEKN